MTKRAGFVAPIGEPHAGKSTLLSRMVGATLSIETRRARVPGRPYTFPDEWFQNAGGCKSG